MTTGAFYESLLGEELKFVDLIFLIMGIRITQVSIYVIFRITGISQHAIQLTILVLYKNDLIRQGEINCLYVEIITMS